MLTARNDMGGAWPPTGGPCVPRRACRPLLGCVAHMCGHALWAGSTEAGPFVPPTGAAPEADRERARRGGRVSWVPLGAAGRAPPPPVAPFRAPRRSQLAYQPHPAPLDPALTGWLSNAGWERGSQWPAWRPARILEGTNERESDQRSVPPPPPSNPPNTVAALSSSPSSRGIHTHTQSLPRPQTMTFRCVSLEHPPDKE